MTTALLAALTGLFPLGAAQAGPAGCTIATIGNDRPEWFCTFYAASDTITYSVAATSGWAIDRIIRINNDGSIDYQRLAGQEATEETIPAGATTGTIEVEAGWYIRAQILMSRAHHGQPLPNLGNCGVGWLCYRQGALDVRS